MTRRDWKETIIFGLGGLLVFVIAGYATVMDMVAYINHTRPLWVYYSKMSGDNDLGVVFTAFLAALSLLGLLAFIF